MSGRTNKLHPMPDMSPEGIKAAVESWGDGGYSDEMSEECRGFDDATEYLLSPTHGPPVSVADFFHPRAATPGCAGCDGTADHAQIVGCPRCDYVRGFNDGLCK